MGNGPSGMSCSCVSGLGDAEIVQGADEYIPYESTLQSHVPAKVRTEEKPPSPKRSPATKRGTEAGPRAVALFEGAESGRPKASLLRKAVSEGVLGKPVDDSDETMSPAASEAGMNRSVKPRDMSIDTDSTAASEADMNQVVLDVSDDEGSRDPLIDQLQREFPRSGALELRRFLQSCKRDMPAMRIAYQKHIDWRAGYVASLSAAPSVKRPNVFTYLGKAYDGSPVMHVRGCCYDPQESVEAYRAYAIRAVESMFPARNSLDQAIWLMDGSPQPGCHNPSLPKVFPFFRFMASDMKLHYPQRVQKVFIYPLSKIQSMCLDTFMKVIMDPTTHAKIAFVQKKEGKHYPAILEQHMDTSLVDGLLTL